jgi:cytochrome c-type biogenesis protein CcmH/NrfG
VREQLALAEEAIQAGLSQHPDEPRLQGLLGVYQASNSEAERAYATLEALGPPDQRPPAIRADLIADAAWCVLFAKDASLFAEAQRAAERAVELCPEDPHYEILLGRIHLERSHPQEAFASLMSAYKRTRDVDQEAQCVAYLALACQAAMGLPGGLQVAEYAARFETAVRSHDVPASLRQRVLEQRQRQS